MRQDERQQKQRQYELYRQYYQEEAERKRQLEEAYRRNWWDGAGSVRQQYEAAWKQRQLDAARTQLQEEERNRRRREAARRRRSPWRRRIAVFLLLLCFALFAANLAWLRFRLLQSLTDDRPTGDLHLVAHRGYTLEAPENTLPAFLAAAEAGYDCIETDVRFTADGRAVLIHNATVDELSDGTGAVAELTLDELLALDFGAGKGARFQGERLPTLDEGLELCRQLDLDVYLELKIPSMTAEQLRSVSEAVKAHHMEEHVTFSSFYLDSLRGMAARNPTCGFQFLTPGGVADMMSVLQAMDWLQGLKETAASVSIGWEYRHVLSELAGMAVQRGVALEAWTVDELEQLDNLPAGFSGVISNRITPEILDAWQSEREQAAKQEQVP